MLVLARQEGTRIVIDGCIELVIHKIRGGDVKLAIDAPKSVTVNREEVEPTTREYRRLIREMRDDAKD